MASKELGIAVSKRPSIPSPIRRYRETEVEGRNGRIYEDLETYDDIEITVEFNFFTRDPKEWNIKFRQIKKWINNIKDNKLKFSDDLSFFYLVNKATITSSERELRRHGKFQATFTCEPFMYLESGLDEMPIATTIYNDYEKTQPIYKITGEGLLTLTCNGKNVTANVGQNLIIDTKLGLSYRFDGAMRNTDLTGHYIDLYLLEGDNTFSYTNGFTIEIIPNWRCL